jgi:ATP-dependent helicase HrpB
MTRADFSAPLPIDSVLDDVRAALRGKGMAVLVAPPGAGKTTRVPLALLDEPWRGKNKILVLEPRRIAARAAAERMAGTLGSRVGDDVGLRARLSSKTSSRVSVEVVTEGVFTRMILDDPELSGVAAILFDEFHERSLDADLGLALALDARTGLRPDLKILVMSATLEASRVAALLDNAPVVASEGRSFPIATRYVGRTGQRIEDDIVACVKRVVSEESGSLLVFLPGQGEIIRVADRLVQQLPTAAIDVVPLYGTLDAGAQDRAIAPAGPGRRKIVLATSIAETSLTIEGVRVVIDSGLARVPRFEPDVGVTRLETVRVSRAAADQRRGRAGRTEPGVCYRLWNEAETQGLVPFAEPEIRSADLSGLLLDCAEWGASDPSSLAWLDPPAAGALAAARADLQALGALDESGRITPDGRRLRAFPLPPRLARMVMTAAERGAAPLAAELAAVLVERGLGGTDPDLAVRLENFQRDRSRRAQDMRGLAKTWARMAGAKEATDDATTSLAALLALAYPERIAKNRGMRGSFLLANGRAGLVDAAHPLAAAPYLVVAELQGRAAAARIVLAVATDEAELTAFASDRMEVADEIAFDATAGAVKARRVRRLGALVLAFESRQIGADDDVSAVLARGLAERGVGALPWSKAQLQLRNRVAFLRNGDGWPDLSDKALAESIDQWLGPYLAGKTRFSEISAAVLDQALSGLLSWPMRQRLDAEAPTHFEAPTGNRYALDYEGTGAPALHIRVQELFGLKEHPTIARGRIPLTLYLLSPAHRPIQITRDLPGFWSGSWAAVKAEMRGRYPKHVWPDDPANALPTPRAKRRGV